MDVGNDHSSHERFFSSVSPRRRTTISRLAFSTDSSTRPSRKTSWSVTAPGNRAITRSLPERSTLLRERARPLRAPANQISSASGDQASPQRLDHPSVRLSRLPSRSTIEIDPASSPFCGCSAKATRSPVGETRTWLNQPEGLHEDFPGGELQPVAIGAPADQGEIPAVGDQSACWMSSATSRGAPPERGARAIVPRLIQPELQAGLQGQRQLACGGDSQEIGVLESQGPRLGALRARGEDLGGLSLPGRAVEDGGAVGGEARRADEPAAEGQALVAGQRATAGALRCAGPPGRPRQPPRRRGPPGGRPGAVSGEPGRQARRPPARRR